MGSSLRDPGTPHPEKTSRNTLETMAANKPLDLEQFIRILIGETLFYDDEYGAIGCLSLVDPRKKRERFIASFMPEDGAFAIEEATAWARDGEGEEAIGYELAADSKENATFQSPEEIAGALLKLAKRHNLLPSVTILFEEDEIA